MIEVPYSELSIVHWWCNRNISPRLYYFHNAFGGKGWALKRNGSTWVLITDDPKYETYIELKYL
jgi:hypothetical protein